MPGRRLLKPGDNPGGAAHVERVVIRRWVARIAASLVALVLLAALGVFLWLRSSLPQTEGEVAVAGIAAPVVILRDENGIATIRAGSEADGFFGLGYAHAQDRLFQMEFMRRLGAGRLSEVVGAATVELDRRMRVLGLYETAEANLIELPEKVVAALEAYAAGVNAFLATRDGALPLEFQILRHEPEPWRPADSLVWGRLMALQLSDNWRAELFRYRLSRHLPPHRLQALWPARPDGDDTAALEFDPADLARMAALEPAFPAIAGASNSWAVDGRRTSSGLPLLANDPHLGLTLPNQWYLARIETPDGVLAGATAPGVPFLVIGHNGRVAWTYTTTHSDTQDLFVEKLVPGDPTRYVTPGGDSLFLSREETIEVRDAEDVTIAVRLSAHGPIVSDIGLAAEAAGGDSVVALAWPGFREDDRSAEALYRMGKSRDAAELREALRLFHSPQQNVVFADVDGAIGFVAAGRVPVRRALASASQMPAEGWTGEHGWTGFLPFEELPQSFDPADGVIVTANNDITPPGYPHFIAARWEEPYRARRIEELLEGRIGLTAAEMGAMQMDALSPPARALLPDLLAALEGQSLGDAAARAREILAAWDYRMDREAAAPLIFAAWLRALDAQVLGPELGPLFEEFASWTGAGAGTLAARESVQDWCGLALAAARETCAESFATALETAVAALSATYGDDPAEWRWGDTHRARFAHPLLDRMPVLGELFSAEIETDGDNFTVNRGTARPGPGMSFPHLHGASLRVVFDLADLDRSLFMLPTGQSGNPLSPHFLDLVARWRDGGFLTIVGSGEAGLTLTPAKG